MLEREGESQGRKFAWVDKWVKMTGDRAKIDAKANNTYIVYETENGLVKEYPDGTIVNFDKKPNGDN
ncbi:hypothetical protein MUO14_13150 [Halobacillus shinanisalinarum]|uniref:Uncharacterized protein n=2 Tax=Bacillaceae TaxID=186817 RepID=A0A1G8RCB6_9BACI|nr:MULTISPECIES: hypothetical protein [Bacillaceae]UOQ91529.1 hypothetical protein MUO14_13150 [Halobacillus shinanisalinarum]SDJ14175.1 hypothetical protein SAMN05216352_1266 [Alteribacillus bidgolensis]